MKLFDRIGDGLLEKLVPGIQAKAGCGKCSYKYTYCGRLSKCGSGCHKIQVSKDGCNYTCDRDCGGRCNSC